MNAGELRALTAAGPAIIFASRDDMLKLLDERDALRREVAQLRAQLNPRGTEGSFGAVSSLSTHPGASDGVGGFLGDGA